MPNLDLSASEMVASDLRDAASSVPSFQLFCAGKSLTTWEIEKAQKRIRQSQQKKGN